MKYNMPDLPNSLICSHDFHYKGVRFINQVSEPVFISPAHANDDLQLPAGAEAEYVSVGAEGSHWVGAGAHGAEPAVSLHAGPFPAAILTCHSSLLLHLSTTDAQTVPAGPTVDHLRDGCPLPSPALLTGCCHGEGRRAHFRDM